MGSGTCTSGRSRKRLGRCMLPATPERRRGMHRVSPREQSPLHGGPRNAESRVSEPLLALSPFQGYNNAVDV